MRSRVLSVTEVVRNFSDFVNRVAYRREAFVLRRGRQMLAELRPLPAGRRLGDLPAVVASLPKLAGPEAKALDSDVRRSRAAMRRDGLRDPWES